MKVILSALKFCDLAAITLALAIAGFSAYVAYLQPSNATRVLIKGAGRKWVFPLNAEETIEVSGPLGNTVVRIQDNRAWVESSPCDNQVCVAAGFLSGRGEFAACLPNFVLVFIEGYDGSEKPDGAVR